MISRVKIIRRLQQMRKERNEMRDSLLNMSVAVSIDNLSHSILHQYKNELINFYQFFQELANDSNLNNRDRYLLEEKMQFIERRIEEVTNELKTDDTIPVNINTAIKEVIKSFSFDLSDLDIQIKLKTDDTLPIIAVDEKKIKDIIFNLLANAEKAIYKKAPKQGEILIETSIDRTGTYLGFSG